MQSACRKIKWVIYAHETQKNARGTAMYLFFEFAKIIINSIKYLTQLLKVTIIGT